jgi:hypothetical protein
MEPQNLSGRREEEKIFIIPRLELRPLGRPIHSQSLYRLLVTYYENNWRACGWKRSWLIPANPQATRGASHVRMADIRTSRYESRFERGSFYFVPWGGVRLSPLGTSATIWPVAPTPDDKWWVWSSCWNENCQGKPKYSEKTCPSATLSTTNPT